MLNGNTEWRKATRLHEVSATGDIRNINGKAIKPWVNTTGYLTIKIFIDGVRKNKKLHRLICEAFIPNPEGKPDVNHKDGNKLNNHIDNLEWCTHAENLRHASECGLISTKPRTLGVKLGKNSKYHNVTWDSTRAKWSSCVIHNKTKHMFKRFDSEIDAALHVNYILDTLGLDDRPRNVIS